MPRPSMASVDRLKLAQIHLHAGHLVNRKRHAIISDQARTRRETKKATELASWITANTPVPLTAVEQRTIVRLPRS